MKNKVKVALVSVLIFPGVGHLMVKSYPRAMFFIITTCLACYLLMSNVITVTERLLSQIELRHVEHVTEMIGLLHEQGALNYSLTTWFAMIWIGLSWIIATLDVYRLGH